MRNPLWSFSKSTTLFSFQCSFERVSRLGVEPRLTDSESVVLPLDDPEIARLESNQLLPGSSRACNRYTTYNVPCLALTWTTVTLSVIYPRPQTEVASLRGQRRGDGFGGNRTHYVSVKSRVPGQLASNPFESLSCVAFRSLSSHFLLERLRAPKFPWVPL